MDIDKVLEDSLSKLAIVEEPTFEEPLFKKNPVATLEPQVEMPEQVEVPEPIEAPEQIETPAPTQEVSEPAESSTGELMGRSMSLINELIAYAQSGVSSDDLMPVIQDLASSMDEINTDLSVRKII